MLCPERVSGNTEHYLVRSHLFHHSACLHSLARVDIAHTCILIRSEHPAGHLAESPADKAVDIV